MSYYITIIIVLLHQVIKTIVICIIYQLLHYISIVDLILGILWFINSFITLELIERDFIHESHIVILCMSLPESHIMILHMSLT